MNSCHFRLLNRYYRCEGILQLTKSIRATRIPNTINPNMSLKPGNNRFSKKPVFPLISLINDSTGLKSSNIMYLFLVKRMPTYMTN